MKRGVAIWMALLLLSAQSVQAVTINFDGVAFSGGPELSAWTDDMSTRNGEVTATLPNGDVMTGQFQNGRWHGAVTVTAAATGLKMVALYEDGVVLSSYSELEADLTLGRYDEAFAKRGESPFLGVVFVERSNVGGSKGVYVERLMYNSPAHIAGLREADLVLSYDAQSVGSMQGLVAALQAVAFGDSKRFLVLRNGQQLVADIRPHIVPRSHPLVKQGKLTASADQLWQAIQQRPVQSWLEAYIDEVADARYLNQARKLRAELLGAEPQAFDRAVRSATLDGYIEYAQRYDVAAKRKEIDALVLKLQAASPDRFFVYDRYRNACGLCASVFGPEYEVLNVGPADLNLMRLLHLQRQGASADKLIEMIGENPAMWSYRELTTDEQQLLLGLGMEKPVLDVVNMKAQEEIVLRGMMEGRHVPSHGASVGVKPQSPEGSTKTGAALECAKLVSALKACDGMGSLGGMACRAVAQKKFKCALP